MEEKQRIAIIPASYNPIHKVHGMIIKLGAQMYDKVYVVVAEAESKEYEVSIEKRAQLVKDVVNNTKYDNIEVVTLDKGKSIPKLAEELEATVVIRGLRGEKISSYEDRLAEDYLEINPNLRFHYITIDKNDISSTLIREKIQSGESIEEDVPKVVAKEIRELWREK